MWNVSNQNYHNYILKNILVHVRKHERIRYKGQQNKSEGSYCNYKINMHKELTKYLELNICCGKVRSEQYRGQLPAYRNKNICKDVKCFKPNLSKWQNILVHVRKHERIRNKGQQNKSKGSYCNYKINMHKELTKYLELNICCYTQGKVSSDGRYRYPSTRYFGSSTLVPI